MKKGLEENFSDISEDELDRAISEKTEEMKAASSDAECRKRSAAGHRERVRERFRQSGLEGFAPHEVLELLLFYTIPMKDTKQTAHELIDRFGSVGGVFDADIDALVQVKGITENSALLFRLIPQLIRIYYEDMNIGASVTSTGKLAEIFRPYFVGDCTEKFMFACFDSDLRLLSVGEVSKGASAAASLSLKEVVRQVVSSGCSMAAIAHNHPLKASTKPTDEDIAVTRRINEVLSAIEVKLMDHIIISGAESYSMRDGGDIGIFD